MNIMNTEKYNEAVKAAREVLSRHTSTPVFFKARLSLTVIALWVLMMTGLWLGCQFDNPLFVVLGVLLVASAQQKLSAWVHEGSHYGLSRNRALNDLLTNLFFAAPVGMNVQIYRRSHLSHHAALSTADDKDRYVHAIAWKGKFLPELLKTLFAFYAVKTVANKYLFRSQTAESSGKKALPTHLILPAAVNLMLLGAVYMWTGAVWGYFFIWVLPLFTIAPFINFVRTAAEHQPEGYPDISLEDYVITRTTTSNFVENFLVYGANFNYHFEHHALASIPAFQLPLAHRELRDAGFYNRYPELLQPSALSSWLNLARK